MSKGDLPARTPGGPTTVPWVTSGVFLLTLLAWFTGTAEWFEYRSGAIAEGHYWRLLTGHFTHLSGDHLFWDALVFFVLGTSMEIRNRPALVATVVSSAVLIALALPVLVPELIVYRGLSGIDTALFVCLVTIVAGEAHRANRYTVLVLVQTGLAGLALKVAFEYLTGQALFVGNGLTPVPEAHLVGGTVGFVIAAFQQHLQDFVRGRMSRDSGSPFGWLIAQ